MIMKNIKKLSMTALLAFALTICLNVRSYGDTLIIENPYKDLKIKQGDIVSSELSISTKNLRKAPKTIVTYSPEGALVKSKLLIKIKDLIKKDNPKEVQEAKIKVDKKWLKVTYFCDVKKRNVEPEDKDNTKKTKSTGKKPKKMSKKLKDTVKKIKKKLKSKFAPTNVTDVYVKILSAQLDGVELEKDPTRKKN